MKENKQLAVIGLGYVGLPLAVLAQSKGWDVTGIDVDQVKIDQINSQTAPFKDDKLAVQLEEYPIFATPDFSCAATANVIIVAVPTPVTPDNQPDLTPLRSALEAVLPYLSESQILIIESTINPGVMDEAIVPLLSSRTDLVIDANDPKTKPALYLAHCPERVNPGDSKWTVRNIPRVIGGYSDLGTKLAANFYRDILDAEIKVMKSATEAEAVKILENTFRDINIAYINEMARSFDALGIDIVSVIEGAATKPFAFLPHYPSNGVGGHCISVDPYYMIERARQVGFDHHFLKLAREINEAMPAYSVEILARELEAKNKKLNGSTIAVLGLSYKKNVSDTRNSPALKSVELLEEQGASTKIFDPLVPELSNVNSLEEALLGVDAILLACDHDELKAMITPELVKKHHISLIIDGKNALDRQSFVNAGITYAIIGRQTLHSAPEQIPA